MILLDTSGLLAAIDSSQRAHSRCAQCLAGARGPFLLSPFVFAELDHLLGTRVGSGAQKSFLEEVARGAYRLEPFDAADVALAQEILEDHPDLPVSLAHASIVVLAGRHGARDVLTLDHRNFRPLRRLDGRQFRLLPEA